MGTQRVLVVESDELLQALLRDLLEDEGYVAELAFSPNAALDVLQRGQPALMLLDMDGLKGRAEELAREVRARYGRRVPIVILGTGADARRLAETVDADASLDKAFDLDAFYAIVSALTKGEGD